MKSGVSFHVLMLFSRVVLLYILGSGLAFSSYCKYEMTGWCGTTVLPLSVSYLAETLDAACQGVGSPGSPGPGYCYYSNYAGANQSLCWGVAECPGCVAPKVFEGTSCKCPSPLVDDPATGGCTDSPPPGCSSASASFCTLLSGEAVTQPICGQNGYWWNFDSSEGATTTHIQDCRSSCEVGNQEGFYTRVGCSRDDLPVLPPNSCSPPDKKLDPVFGCVSVDKAGCESQAGAFWDERMNYCSYFATPSCAINELMGPSGCVAHCEVGIQAVSCSGVEDCKSGSGAAAYNEQGYYCMLPQVEAPPIPTPTVCDGGAGILARLDAAAPWQCVHTVGAGGVCPAGETKISVEGASGSFCAPSTAIQSDDPTKNCIWSADKMVCYGEGEDPATAPGTACIWDAGLNKVVCISNSTATGTNTGTATGTGSSTATGTNTGTATGTGSSTDSGSEPPCEGVTCNDWGSGTGTGTDSSTSTDSGTGGGGGGTGTGTDTGTLGDLGDTVAPTLTFGQAWIDEMAAKGTGLSTEAEGFKTELKEKLQGFGNTLEAPTLSAAGGCPIYHLSLKGADYSVDFGDLCGVLRLIGLFVLFAAAVASAILVLKL